MASTNPRHDYYQTDSLVNLSVFVKGCKEEDVKLELTEKEFHLEIQSPISSTLDIVPLFADIDPQGSSYKVLGTKVEVTLHKKQPGIQWTALQGQPSKTIPFTNYNKSSHSSRSKSKWETFTPEDEGEGSKDHKGEASIDDFFKNLYADADEDTRRAMMKSYQESGGTSLSTNWEEVKKKKVETHPPSGMEAKKW